MDRRVGAWLVAAVVTVALVAGGVLVARGGDRSPAVLPALDLAATGQGGAAAAEPAAAADGAGPAVEPAPAPGGTGTGRAGAAVGGSPRWPPVTYRLGAPLPDLPDRARAWTLGDTPDAGRLASLAAALGLDGRPVEEAGGWTLRDGRRGLTAHHLAGVPWTYEANLLGPCLRPAAPRRPGGVVPCLDPDRPVSSPPAPAKPLPSPRPSRPVAPARPLPRPALPSPAEAERVARDLAARAGLDLDGARVRVRDDYATRTVTIDPAVGGQPTSGFAWTVAVAAGGTIRHATGWLATPRPADTYPLIGVDAGFEQLKRLPPIGPLSWAETPAVEVDPCPAGSKLPCAAKPLAPRVATVTGVRLGLLRLPALATGARGERPGGLAYLLPAYLFDLQGGWTDTRAVLAVPDRYLTR